MYSHLHVVLSHTLPTTLISVESSGACNQSCLPQTFHKRATSCNTVASLCSAHWLSSKCYMYGMCGIIPHTVRLITLGLYNPNDFSHWKMYCHMYILGWTSGCEGRGKNWFPWPPLHSTNEYNIQCLHSVMGCYTESLQLVWGNTLKCKWTKVSTLYYQLPFNINTRRYYGAYLPFPGG